MWTAQVFFQELLFEPGVHIVPDSLRLLHYSPFIIAFAIIKLIFVCSGVHVWSSQFDHELLGDGNNIPQVPVASRLSTGPSTGPDTGAQANSASMAVIEVHC